jgi:hypothetical protein
VGGTPGVNQIGQPPGPPGTNQARSLASFEGVVQLSRREISRSDLAAPAARSSHRARSNWSEVAHRRVFEHAAAKVTGGLQVRERPFPQPTLSALEGKAIGQWHDEGAPARHPRVPGMLVATGDCGSSSASLMRLAFNGPCRSQQLQDLVRRGEDKPFTTLNSRAGLTSR